MKMKKKTKIVLIIIVIALALIAIGISLFVVVPATDPKAKLKEIPEYGYYIDNNDSDEYKKLFEELEVILHAEELDKEAYATKMTEMFIVDFYSLEDKTSKYDVGGVTFVYPQEQTDFIENATNTMYNYLETTINHDRTQELPKVKEVTINSIETTTYAYLDKTTENAYQIAATWTYEQDLGYSESATIYIVEEEGKLWLVELTNEEE